MTVPFSNNNPSIQVQSRGSATGAVAGGIAVINAIVETGEVTADDSDAQYEITEQVFTDYQIKNRFESDKHIYMMGITSPGGFQGKSVAFTQLASPTLLWISDWTAASFIDQPDIPDSESKDDDWVLMDEHYEPGMLVVPDDGTTPFYRISGTFVYGHKDPDIDVIKNINYSRPPWLADVFQRTIQEGMVQQGLINTTSATGSASPGVPQEPDTVPVP